MDIANISKSIILLAGFSLIFGIVLIIAFEKFGIKKGEKEAKIRSLLRGVNCGACGSSLCDDDVQAMVEDGNKYSPMFGTASGSETAIKVGDILSVKVSEAVPMVCVVRCQGGLNEAIEKYEYHGPIDCRLSYILFGGDKACADGCLGGGHCASVCPFGAIKIGADRLPSIDPNKCTACGICVKECPRQVLELVPQHQLIFVACKSLDKDNAVADVCQVGCIGCVRCIEVCPFPGAIEMIGDLPRINYEKCTSCSICFSKCPTKSFADRAKARPYAIISAQCNGCGECIKVCQFAAIEGELNKRHVIIKDMCIGCGRCFEVCPIKVITMAGALGHARKI